LHRACCFDYFFNIPTHASIIYTLKSAKFTLKHLKTLKILSVFKCFNVNLVLFKVYIIGVYNCAGGKIETNEMGRACSVYGGG